MRAVGTVEVVAIDVEVVDHQPGVDPLVDLEPRQHLGGVQQADVAQRLEVVSHVTPRERGEVDLHRGELVDAHRRPGGVDVALDERRLARRLVGLHHQRLHDRRVGVVGEHGQHQPQRRRHERQPERLRAQRRQVQARRDDGDHHQQQQRRELGVDHGVGGALHEAAPLVGGLVAPHPVVGGLQRGEHGEQHGDVAAGALADAGHRRGEHHAAVQQVGDQRDEQHHDRGDEQPVEHEAEERQLEHVEADVDAELGVGGAEALAVAEQQPRLPLPGGGRGEGEGEQGGDEVAVEPEAPTEHLVEALDVGVHVGREPGGREPVGDGEVGADIVAKSTKNTANSVNLARSAVQNTLDWPRPWCHSRST